MPLKKAKKPSMLKKILSGGLQGAGNALLLQSLLGEEDAPVGAAPPFEADPLLGATESPSFGDLDAEFPALEAPESAPPLPRPPGGLENMSLEEILELIQSMKLQQDPGDRRF